MLSRFAAQFTTRATCTPFSSVVSHLKCGYLVQRAVIIAPAAIATHAPTPTRTGVPLATCVSRQLQLAKRTLRTFATNPSDYESPIIQANSDPTATLACPGVPDNVNPVADYHNNFLDYRPEERQSSQHPALVGRPYELADLRLLSGPWWGIAHLVGQVGQEAVDSSEGLQSCLRALAGVRDVLIGGEGGLCLYGGMSSEYDYQVLPIIVKCTEGDAAVSPEAAAVAALGVSQQLAGSSPPLESFATVEEFLRNMEVEDLQLPELPDLTAEDANNLTMLEAAKGLFQESGLTQGPYLKVVVGNDDLFNPILVLWMARCKDAPFWLGLISAVIWT